MATTYNVAELAAGLRAMLETEGCDDAIRVLCQAVAAAGAAVEIDEE